MTDDTTKPLFKKANENFTKSLLEKNNLPINVLGHNMSKENSNGYLGKEILPNTENLDSLYDVNTQQINGVPMCTSANLTPDNGKNIDLNHFLQNYNNNQNNKKINHPISNNKENSFNNNSKA